MYMIGSLFLGWVATRAMYAAVWCRSRAAGTPLAYKEASDRVDWMLSLRTHGVQEQDGEHITYH